MKKITQLFIILAVLLTYQNRAFTETEFDFYPKESHRMAKSSGFQTAALFDPKKTRESLKDVNDNLEKMRSPAAAGIMSLVIPGLGDFYNSGVLPRQAIAGLAFMITNIAGNILISKAINVNCNPNVSPAGYVWSRNCSHDDLLLGFGVTLGTFAWFGSMGNSISTARKLNARQYSIDKISDRHKEKYRPNDVSLVPVFHYNQEYSEIAIGYELRF